jgi:hypothetical protein
MQPVTYAPSYFRARPLHQRRLSQLEGQLWQHGIQRSNADRDFEPLGEIAGAHRSRRSRAQLLNQRVQPIGAVHALSVAAQGTAVAAPQMGSITRPAAYVWKMSSGRNAETT